MQPSILGDQPREGNVTQAQEFAEAGARIKKLREIKKLSQEDIAFEAGIDQSTYSKVERLGPQVVSWTKVQAIAAALGCRIEVNFIES